MFKCLLSFEVSHHVIYLPRSNESLDYLTYSELKLALLNRYQELIKQLALDLEDDRFEIFDEDFEQYVIMDQWTKIKHLSKLKVISIERCSEKRRVHKIDEKSCVDLRNTHHISSLSSIENTSHLSNNTVIYKLDKLISKTSHEDQSSSGKISLINERSADCLITDCTSFDSSCSQTVRNTIKKSSPINSLQNVQSDLVEGVSNDFNKAPKCISNQNANLILNNSFKTYQTVECQTETEETEETERRIIHLKDNLFMRHCKQLQIDHRRLIDDNKRLNAKLELYKQGSVSNATNYLEDFVNNADEIERLKKELLEAKEEQKTIMDAFKKKSKEFRRVVYLLTGFKFDALEQRKYRVSHIYSNPNEYLFFTFEKDDVINLLGNEVSEKFFDLIKTYLVNWGSYPSFLASITIKLFEQKCSESKKKELKQS